MHLRGFWISGDYVSGVAAKLPSRPRAVVAASLCQGSR